MQTTVKQLYRETNKFLNKKIIVNGWVRTTRSSGATSFIELSDGTFFKRVQVVFDEKLKNFADISKVALGTALEVFGMVVASPAAGQPFEIKAEKITVLGEVAGDYSLQKKKHSFEFLRTIGHLRPRANTFQAVFRLRSALSFAIHQFFQERGFVYVQTPVITANDCEGAGEMFKVTTLDLANVPRQKNNAVDFSQDFFGKEAGLTVSGQLEGEAFALAFKNIYTFGPTFRAENSNTARHAAEFWMIEPEIAFAELADNMKLAEDMLKYLINYVLKNLPEEMEFFNKFIDTSLLARLTTVKDTVFGHVTYTEAVEILKKAKKKFDYPVAWGIDLQTEHERYLSEEVYKKPVFVTNYPKDIKAFYMRQNDDGKTVAAMDLLVPGVGEIIGGSQREERLDLLTQRMREMKIKNEGLEWYLDLRRYGGVKHAGFGLGFERALMYLSGMQNIRDVIPFPRTPKSIAF
ncbi:asparagine--tRNA ligase [Candidatus Falkowbacteria bacterium RIFOXYA2_FULL_47_9]|uniref:Asparagine--tRNA ligase n=1 Tax=Candidatus Falkowbacteria bacterium RIFOXYA2_FULL_47_9 TaxID=1797995 RepID=A0A1F5SQ24_9BACT|nr:MAG: asparagine--tRNA ligase [Candidatus Falkowbacteria bacterium RIFOXYA2_FULL_47_9]